MITSVQTDSASHLPWCQTGCNSPALDGSGNGAPHGHMPADRVTLSAQAMQKSVNRTMSTSSSKSDDDLSDAQKAQVEKLKRRDSEVKAHEQAHMAAGSGIVQGGASFQYQSGPDGKLYAVGGEVRIDTSPESSPEATIRKMQQVRRAALAPAQPSGTDRAVAAQAAQMEAQARMQKAQMRDSAENVTDRSNWQGLTEDNKDKGIDIRV